MGQGEILVCLEKNEEPLTISEISEKLKLGERNVQRALKTMLHYNEVIKIEKAGRKSVYEINLELWK